MKTIDILKKCRSGALTCSEVAQLLAEQPTRNETSHAHMHMLDGFQVGLATDPLSRVADWWSGRAQRAADWGAAAEAHLGTESQSPLPIYDPNQGHPSRSRWKTLIWAERAGQDVSRMALPDVNYPPHSSYNLRSGLPEVPGVAAQRATENVAFRLKPGGVDRVVATEANPYAVPLGTTGWVMQNGQRKIQQQNGAVIRAAVPRLPSTLAHTMFEDSESMVMHLTAALKSTGGKAVLTTLITRGAGSKETVGLFSKTAVDAVSQKVASAAPGKAMPEVLQRTANTHGARRPDGTADVTGSFTRTKKDIDHIVLVMRMSDANELTIVTCYPSPVPTTSTIGISNTPKLDIIEHKFGTKIAVAIDAVLPTIVW